MSADPARVAIVGAGPGRGVRRGLPAARAGRRGGRSPRAPPHALGAAARRRGAGPPGDQAPGRHLRPPDAATRLPAPGQRRGRRDISHEELMAHYTAVVYATGAQTDKSLGIPGEDLPGSRPATEFVAWYNGHPDFRGLEFDLSTRCAVVIGNGNVAADVTRVLTRSTRELERTDVADHALEALRRAGSSGWSCSAGGARPGGVHELRAARARAHGGRRRRGAARRDRARRGVAPVAGRGGNVHRPQERGGPAGVRRAARRTGAPAGSSCGSCARRSRSAARGASRRSTSAATSSCAPRTVRCGRDAVDEPVETIECGLVLRSVGYQAVPLPDVPFDERHFVLPNDHGRVRQPDGRPLPGVYAVGWIKRGPTGILGTNKRDAEETIGCLSEDLLAGALRSPPVPVAVPSTRCWPSAGPTSSRSMAGVRSTRTSASAAARSCVRGSSSPRTTSCSPRPAPPPGAPEQRREHRVATLTQDMKRVVREQRLGFYATVCEDGSPNLSPKGTTSSGTTTTCSSPTSARRRRWPTSARARSWRSTSSTRSCARATASRGRPCVHERGTSEYKEGVDAAARGRLEPG